MSAQALLPLETLVGSDHWSQIDPGKRRPKQFTLAGGYAAEYKTIRLRELYSPDVMCDTPDKAASFWRQHIPSASWYRHDNETFCVLLLNTRRRIIGFQMCSIGTLDTILVSARDVFRPAICTAAAALILAHNHPSGDPTPSEADIKVTRELIRGGQLLKIDVLDHVIMGQSTTERPQDYVSLRELGYFYN